MKIILKIVLALAGIISFFSTFAQQIKPNSITPIRFNHAKHSLQDFSSNEVELTNSLVKDREISNTLYVKRLDPDRLLHNFRINAGLPSTAIPLEGWESPNIGLRGHFLGHYLSAASIIIARDNDSAFEKRLNYIINELAICQDHLGGYYLSAFPASDLDILEKKFGGVWAPYYTLHKICKGLLDVYTNTGNKKAYAILLKEVAYIQQRMDRLPDSTIEKLLYTAEANPLNEVGGMNDVLHRLYAVSKNPQHLRLAQLFDRKWFYQPLMDNVDNLSGLHSNTHVVLVNGFLQRYQNTGEEKFKDAGLHFWDMLLQHHAYANGSSSGPRPIATSPTSKTAEHWGNRDQLSKTLDGNIAEACVIHNTQKITAELFRITSNPKYADQYFNSYYNAVLPLQHPTTGMSVYHLGLGNAKEKKFLKENDFKCCNGTGIEAFAQLNENIYYHDEKNIWINLYVPSKLRWNNKQITIEQQTQLPQNNAVLFKLSNPVSFSYAMNFFIPSWANGETSIFINGKLAARTSKTNAYFKIERKWKGNEKVELKFNLDYHVKAMPDDSTTIALFYGPILLAFETNKEIVLHGNLKTLKKHLVKEADRLTFIMNDLEGKYVLKPFYDITTQFYGVYARFKNTD